MHVCIYICIYIYIYIYIYTHIHTIDAHSERATFARTHARTHVHARYAHQKFQAHTHARTRTHTHTRTRRREHAVTNSFRSKRRSVQTPVSCARGHFLSQASKAAPCARTPVSTPSRVFELPISNAFPMASALWCISALPEVRMHKDGRLRCIEDHSASCTQLL